MAYGRYSGLFNNILTLSARLRYSHYKTSGENYRHHLNTFSASFQANINYKDFSLLLTADTRDKYLMGNVWNIDHYHQSLCYNIARNISSLDWACIILSQSNGMLEATCYLPSLHKNHGLPLRTTAGCYLCVLVGISFLAGSIRVERRV